MENSKTATRTADEADLRLDVFVASFADVTRSAAAKLCEDGKVFVNGKAAAKNYRTRVGDKVEVNIPEPETDDAKAEDIPLDIVYEDDDIVVINKPVGMVVHPAAGNREGTLVNALLYRLGDSLSGIGGVARPGIVHRIDKDTSGLIAVAKNDKAHLSLSAQLKDHSMRRTYLAIATGGFSSDEGVIDVPIGRNPNDRKKMAVIRDSAKRSRNAVTHYTVLERFRGFTLVKCQLETGRTHQIRVHLSYIGHPLMGDKTYGGGHSAFEKANSALLVGQCLHAAELTLTHPTTGEVMTFRADPPENFVKILEKLRKMSEKA